MYGMVAYIYPLNYPKCRYIRHTLSLWDRCPTSFPPHTWLTPWFLGGAWHTPDEGRSHRGPVSWCIEARRAERWSHQRSSSCHPSNFPLKMNGWNLNIYPCCKGNIISKPPWGRVPCEFSRVYIFFHIYIYTVFMYIFFYIWYYVLPKSCNTGKIMINHHYCTGLLWIFQIRCEPVFGEDTIDIYTHVYINRDMLEYAICGSSQPPNKGTNDSCQTSDPWNNLIYNLGGGFKDFCMFTPIWGKGSNLIHIFKWVGSTTT